MKVKFTWDTEKAKRNFKKHGVSFEQTTQVFADPFRLIIDDREDDAGELRLHAIGFADGDVLLLVVFIDRSEDEEQEIVHIISARKATAYEKHLYASHLA
jgi:hypothetical protein